LVGHWQDAAKWFCEEGQMKHQMTALRLVSLVALVTSSVMGQKQTQPVRVFVFTAADPSGFVDDNSKQRRDSVEDLKKDLSKNSNIQIVADQATADVTLQVLARGNEETGSTTVEQGYDGQWHTYPDTVRVVRVVLRAGAYSALVEGTSNFAQRGLIGVSQGLWRVAADNAAKDIGNWIKANHDILISRRSVAQVHFLDTDAGREACVPDMRTPKCRVALAKYLETQNQKDSPDLRVTLEGNDGDILVCASPTLFDDPKRQKAFQGSVSGGDKGLCQFRFKKVVLVGSPNTAKYEFDLNCTGTSPPGPMATPIQEANPK
jgi:hypothetical protein